MTVGGIGALAAVALLVVAAALLSGLETVLARLELVRALRLEEDGSRGAGALVWLLEHRARALNVVLTLTVTVRIAAAVAVVALAVELGSGPVGAVLAAVALTVVSLVVGEIGPRTLVLRHLESAGLRLARPGRVLVRVLGPLVGLLVGAGRALVRGRGEVSGPYAPDDEVEAHLEDAEDGEPLADDELAMIHSIFELGDTVVREIMVPRPDMVTVEESAGLHPVVDTMIEHGYSRVPVYRDTLDRVVGVIYAKDLLRRLALEPDAAEWRDLMREPTFVPETKQIDDLLRSLQEQAVHQAVVVDEYGGVVGLVTIEDILEEIVGEIVDEHDREDPLVEVIDGRGLRIDARLPVDDLNELLDADLPSEDWDSVGGLVFGLLGHVPAPGETVELHGFRLSAERVQGRRVATVVVTRLEPVEPTAGQREVTT